MADRDAGRAPTAAAGLGVTMAADALGRGWSHLLVRALRDVAAAHGLARERDEGRYVEPNVWVRHRPHERS